VNKRLSSFATTLKKPTFQGSVSGWCCSLKVDSSEREKRRAKGTTRIDMVFSVPSKKNLPSHSRYAVKNNLPHLNYVTLPRNGAMKTIIDVLGPGNDEDPAASTTPPHSMKDISKVINGDADEFYIDNEYTNQQSPPTTPLRNAYNANNHGNNKGVQKIIGDDENLKEKIGEAEISAKKTLKYVLDITVAYPDGKPLDLPNIVTGLRRSCQTHLLYRLYRCSEVRIITANHLELNDSRVFTKFRFRVKTKL
jgi:hypothetical protein